MNYLEYGALPAVALSMHFNVDWPRLGMSAVLMLAMLGYLVYSLVKR